MALPRATHFELQASESAQLDRLLARYVESTALACSRVVGAGEWLCALGLVYVEELFPGEWIAFVDGVSALTERERRALFAESDAGAALYDLWTPAIWTTELLGDPGNWALDEGADVGAALHRAGCEDPTGAFCCELSYRLGRERWSDDVALTEDFACLVTKHPDDRRVVETFRETAPPQAMRAYEARGWLRWPDDDLLEDDDQPRL